VSILKSWSDNVYGIIKWFPSNSLPCFLESELADTYTTVMGRQGMPMEYRELMVGYGHGLWSGSGLGWNSDAMEGQGGAGNATFCDWDRDVARAGTWCDEDGYTKAWQDEDEDREARNRR
jgi:hypothetical protein